MTYRKLKKAAAKLQTAVNNNPNCDLTVVLNSDNHHIFVYHNYLAKELKNISDMKLFTNAAAKAKNQTNFWTLAGLKTS